ncbi:MAG: hypothetical protein ACRD4P_14795, partial [Bryobacteraceae bacterium]
VLVLRPSVLIEPYAYLDPSDPFKTQFSVTNDGLLSINDVQISCRLDNVVAQSRNIRVHIADSESRDFSKSYPEIDSHATETAECLIPL